MTKYNRKPSTRKEKNKVIISLEDESSSYNYLNKIKNKFNLKDILIISSKNKSDPLNVIKKAHKKYLDGDTVFIVVDKDQHNHERAKKYFIDKNLKGEYLVSTPCFEYWLLLHEQCTDKPFICAEDIGKELSKILIKKGIDYHKNKIDYDHFVDSEKIKQATSYSKNNYKENVNPSTNLHLLIDILNFNNKIYI